MNTINDELLSKFLDGKTTEEENQKISAYCDAHGETIEELLMMRQAASMADKNSDFVIDEVKALHFVEQTLQTHSRKKRVTLAVWISVAAAMAILIVVGTFLFFSNENSTLIGHETQPHQTVAEDSTDKSNATLTDTSLMQTHRTDRVEPLQEEPQLSENKSSEESRAPLSVEVSEKSTAATQSVENAFSMVKPSKTPYRIICKNLDKSFVFQWETVNAKKIEFILMNDQHKVIVEKKELNLNSFSLMFRDVAVYSVLYWKVKIVFEDNTTTQKTGRIDIQYEL